MEIKAEGTTITASHAEGLFYGIMTFIGLLDISHGREGMPITEMTIYDKPRFNYRGHQIDSARNFRTKESVLQTIDAMALYKLNNLHFGLSNDEGWRLEIPGLEELTTVGSRRCFDLSEESCILPQLGSGPDASEEPQFYSVADYVEILKYADARNVKVAPEFNMPGHARAAVVAMEARAKKGDASYRLMDPEDETELLTVQFYDRSSIINPCLDSSVMFVEKLVDEVWNMYGEAQLSLDVWQFGGDEAKNILLGGGYSAYDLPKEAPFSKSPACIKKMQEDPTINVDTDAANYWALKVNQILKQKEIREMLAWEDGLNGMTKDEFEIDEVSVNFWSTLFWGGTDGLVQTSKTGFGIIMANPDYLYFDFPYEVHPEERGYYWAARENSVAKVFSFAPENLPQNAETSLDRDGNTMDVTTPDSSAPVIKGMQGQTWSETVRTETQHQEMTFPRVLAVAERAWHRGSWELDWTPNQNYQRGSTNHVPKDQLAADFKGFNTVLGCREVRKVSERLGISYRVPPPGAIVEGGMLIANTELPCTRIQYSLDRGVNWSEYSSSVQIGRGKHVSLKSVSADGGLESRVVTIDQSKCLDCQGVCESDPSKPFNSPQICSSDSEVDSSAITSGVSSSTDFATSLASNLLFSIQTNANFNHGIDCAAHKADWSLCYQQTFTFRYTGTEDYTDSNFRIYFSSIHRVLEVDSPAFEYGHIVGDLTYIQPTASFQGFEAESEVTFPVIFEYWSVQETDKMPRFFVVDTRDDSTAVIPNTDTEDLHSFVIPYTSSMKTEGDNNVPMTAENRHTRNEELMEGADTDVTNRIIPTPFRVEVGDAAQTFDVFGVSLINANLLGKMQSGAEELISKITMKPASTNEYNVELAIGTLPLDITSTESYQMEIKAEGTTITASHAEGLFYGIMSFLGLLDISSGSAMPVKEMTIYDKPRFNYRGHQIDSARNFRTKESVLQTIDAMALYKLNNLHFGLSNDEGWRLEIPGLEELTTVGSRRCFDLSEESCILPQLGSGPDASEEPQFYSVADYVEILKYADARNVKVAPEFNMPGHARAAVVAMEARAKKGDASYRLMDPEDETELLTVQFYDRSSIINPCLDSSVKFVEKLVDEVWNMYGEAQLSLDMWQFGGDEAKNILLGGGYSAYDLPKEAPFSKSPACIKKMQEDPTINVDTDAANYWALKVNQILKQKEIREMLAWEDGLNGMTKDEFEIDEVSVNFWSTLFWGGTDGLVQTSKTGFGIIMANPDYLYFDFPYEVHPEERGYYWAARENSVAKVFSFAPENLPQNAETSLDRDGNTMDVTTPDSSAPVIKGMQGQTWSETVRTETQHQEMTFPRVLAVAERAWHRGSWELDWTPNQNYQRGSTNHVPKDQLAADFKGFNTVLGCREVRKVSERLGISYRVPPPGAIVEGGMLIANTELPCTRIQYSLDRGVNWSEYSSSVQIGRGKHVSLKSVSADGGLESRVVTIDQSKCLDCQGVCESDPSKPFNSPQICSSDSEVDSSAITSGVSSSTDFATSLASNLLFSIQTNANFNHGIDCAAHKADWSLCYQQTFTFRYTGTEDYTDSNFRIYFSSIHRVLEVDSPAFEYGHIVGDLTYIQPTASFQGFEAESEVTFPVIFEYWSVQETDKMPRFFVVDTRDDSTAVIPNTDTEDLHSFVIPYTSSMKTEGDNNVPMTAENRHTRNEELMEGADTDVTNRIIPTPFRVEVGDAAQTFDVFGVSLINANLLGKMQSGAEELISKITMKPASTNEYNVELAIGTLPLDITSTESYQMEIKAEGTTITASHAEGLFYGIMSFLGLLDISSGSAMPVKEMTIYDKPRFNYRGHQIDSARNFRTKESVLQTIDAMALYKLNNLHFGLSNDEGWRLEIPGLEELTTVGSRRCFDLSEESCILPQLGSGPDASEEPQFYSVADYVEILKYADARNVKVAPEFNMPGHARAAVVAMEARAKKGDASYRLMDPEDETELLTVQFYDRSSIINPCLDSSLMFVEKLVDEVWNMYGEAQLSLDVWQFGGDEAKNILLGGGYSAYDLPKEAPFSKSPACIKKMQEDPTINVDTDAANYWALKVNQILKQKEIREMLAWEDGLNGMTKDEFEIDEVSVNFWSTLFWGGTDGLVQTSKTGFGIIMANPDYLYFDFPYEVHPEERGYYWAARENSVAKVFSFAPENLPQNAETSLDRDGNTMDVTTPDSSAPVIKGMQGQTWSETVRTETQHQEMTFPRVLAVAERAWHRGSWELDWTPNQNYQRGSTNHVPKDQLAADFKGFNTVLGCREVRKVSERLGISYRVPPPGAIVEGGILIANTELPCTRIQYSLDRGVNWSEYSSSVQIGRGKHVSLKSVSADGGLESRVVTIDQSECLDCQGVCESDPSKPFNSPQICSSDSEVDSSEISFPTLSINDPTYSPSSSKLPIPEQNRCSFCEFGIPDRLVVPPGTGSQTCGDVKENSVNYVNGEELCDVIQSVESSCCSFEPFDPCKFCEGGISDLTLIVPNTGGQTCGDVRELAARHANGDPLCNTIQSEQSSCCPSGPFDPCTFCGGGIPDLTLVVPGTGGLTCGEVRQSAVGHKNGDALCNNIHSVEEACCPEPTGLCTFCSEGIPDLTVVVPEAGGKTCGEMKQSAAFQLAGGDSCNAIQSVERSCCPNLASNLADHLTLRIQMSSNFDHVVDCTSHNADWGLCYFQLFILEFSGNEDYINNNFAIYFSSIHRLLSVDHPDFEYGHVVGDLTYIKPTALFKGFEAGSVMTIPVVFEYWSVQETDKMPRFFVVDTRDDSTAVIPNTDTEDMADFVIPYSSSMKTEGDNNVPMTPENRFSRNEELMGGVGTDTSTRIIPTPYRVDVSESSKTFGVDGVTLVNADLLGRLQSGAEELISKIILKPASDRDHVLILTIGTLPQDITGTESYLMEITAEGTTITASQEGGLFYGVMSFLGLLDTSSGRGTMPVKEMTIYDKPRFNYRGHQIDSARNFRTKESVLQTIDAMTLYKLNNLHFGLSNDEGWRLEIPGLEELTTVGSRRCFDLSEESCILPQLGSGPDASEEPQFYSVADYVEILKYADARNVKVAPEFNMPGHARAAVVAMEARAKNGDASYRLMDPEDETELLTVQFYDRSSIINPCLDSSVMFVEKLVDEVWNMYGEAQLSLDMWQFGGDEAKNILLGGGYSAYDLPKEAPFSKSPACIKKMQEDPTINVDTDAANYWALKVNQILKQKEIREMLAWEDGLNGMTKDEFEIDEVSVNFWSTLFWGGTDGLVQTSKTGFGIIMANPDYLYFDFPYEVHPEERGYYWAARENSVAKVFSFAPENLPQNAETSLDRDGNAMDITTPVWPAPVIKGMQGQTWSETVRTETQHQEMTFPRVLAVAERAWHRGSWELDWTPNQNYRRGSTNHVPKDQLAADFKGFNTVLGCREVRKIWQRLGISYRVPPPGGMVEGGTLIANTELPCTRIQYSLDRGVNWSEYFAPVKVGEGKYVSLKSLSADGGLESRVVTIDQSECLGCQGVCESNPLSPFHTPQVCGVGSTLDEPPFGSEETNIVSDSDENIGSFVNPSGNELFCGYEFSFIADSCLSSKPCPSGLSEECNVGTNKDEGCFRVSKCTGEYEAAGATSTETLDPDEKCHICAEDQVHSIHAVFFEGQEFFCHEFDSIFKDGDKGADSPSCKLAKELYTGSCCINSDGSIAGPAPSPSFFDGGEYPTLWVMNPKSTATTYSLTFSLVCAIMTSFFVMHL